MGVLGIFIGVGKLEVEYARISVHMANILSILDNLCCMQRQQSQPIGPSCLYILRQMQLTYLSNIRFNFDIQPGHHIPGDRLFVCVFAIPIKSHISCIRLLLKLAPWLE